jgi:integrase
MPRKFARVPRAPGQLAGIRKLRHADGRVYYRVRRKGIGDRRAATLTEARQLWHDMYEPGAGLVTGDRRLTVGRYTETWLADLDHLRPATRDAYAHAARVFTSTAIGRARLADVSTTDVTAYFRWLRTTYRGPYGRRPSPNTVRNLKTALSSLFSHAVAHGVRPTHPVRGAKLAKPTRAPIDPPTDTEVRAILAACADEPALYALVQLAAGTGARIGELLALSWRDVELEPTDGRPARIRIAHTMHPERRTLGETKTGSRRTVSLPAVAVDALRAHRAAQRELIMAAGDRWQPSPPVPGGLVFTMASGRAVRHHVAGERLTAAIERSGIGPARRAGGHAPLTWHDFRHAFATRWLASGRDMYRLAKVLGHASIRQTVDTYGHLESTDVSDAADALAGAYS